MSAVSTPAQPSRARQLVARLVLGVWAGFLCAVCATFLGSHLVPLPQPTVDDPVLEAAVAAHRGMDGVGRFVGVHVLYGECPCSLKIADTVLDPSRSRPSDVHEVMVLVGADAALEQRALAAGFVVETVEMDDLLPTWGVEAAPLFIVADPLGQLQYVGGYTSRKQGPDVRDLAILQDVRSNTPVATLPLFGCAVSQTLQAAVDPLGLR